MSNPSHDIINIIKESINTIRSANRKKLDDKGDKNYRNIPLMNIPSEFFEKKRDENVLDYTTRIIIASVTFQYINDIASRNVGTFRSNYDIHIEHNSEFKKVKELIKTSQNGTSYNDISNIFTNIINEYTNNLNNAMRDNVPPYSSTTIFDVKYPDTLITSIFPNTLEVLSKLDPTQYEELLEIVKYRPPVSTDRHPSSTSRLQSNPVHSIDQNHDYKYKKYKTKYLESM